MSLLRSFNIIFTAVACTYVAIGRTNLPIQRSARIDLATGRVFDFPTNMADLDVATTSEEKVVIGADNPSSAFDWGLLAFLDAEPQPAEHAIIATSVRPGHLTLDQPLVLPLVRRQDAHDGATSHYVENLSPLGSVIQAYVDGLPGRKSRVEGAALAAEISQVRHMSNLDQRSFSPLWTNTRKGWLELTALGEEALRFMQAEDPAATAALEDHFQSRLGAWSEAAVASLLQPIPAPPAPAQPA
jgi:hypothetical protein